MPEKKSLKQELLELRAEASPQQISEDSRSARQSWGWLRYIGLGIVLGVFFTIGYGGWVYHSRRTAEINAARQQQIANNMGWYVTESTRRQEILAEQVRQSPDEKDEKIHLLAEQNKQLQQQVEYKESESISLKDRVNQLSSENQQLQQSAEANNKHLVSIRERNEELNTILTDMKATGSGRSVADTSIDDKAGGNPQQALVITVGKRPPLIDTIEEDDALFQTLKKANGYNCSWRTDLGRGWDANKAIVLYDRRIKLGAPSQEIFYNNLGAALQCMGDREAARTAYQTAVSVNKGYLLPSKNLVGLLVETGEAAAAIELYNNLIRIRMGDNQNAAVENADVFNNVGIALLTTRNFDGAKVFFQYAADTNPAEPSFAHNKQILDYALGQISQNDLKAVQIVLASVNNTTDNQRLSIKLKESADRLTILLERVKKINANYQEAMKVDNSSKVYQQGLQGGN